VLLCASITIRMVPPAQFTTEIVALGGYQDFDGTSAATPEVAGCVALLKQRFPRECHMLHPACQHPLHISLCPPCLLPEACLCDVIDEG
jgi:Subtilase family